jgi:hypothetical protein
LFCKELVSLYQTPGGPCRIRSGNNDIGRSTILGAKRPANNGKAVCGTHAAFDLTALAIIYWDLESKVAHLLFR